METFYVCIREVHINTVRLEAPKGTSEEDLKRMARKKHEDLDTLDTEYSHTMDEEFWTIDGPFNYGADPSEEEEEDCEQDDDCDCNDCVQERRRLDLIHKGTHPEMALAQAQKEREASEKEDTIYCKLCHSFQPLRGANSHQDGWVCDGCWDERLRSTQ